MSKYGVIIVGIEERTYKVKFADDMGTFNRTSVATLRAKIIATTGAGEDMRLLFAGKQLVDHRNLESYNIKDGSTITVVVRVHGGAKKQRIPRPGTTDKNYPRYGFPLPFTSDKDCIDPYSDEQRVKMSCGHAVSPNSLTSYCHMKIDQNIFEITCTSCKREWDYNEVCLAAMFTDEERRYFEATMSQFSISQFCDMKECPSCSTFVERIDTNNLRVTCHICTRKKGRTYDFCWNCLKEWKSPPVTSSVKCGDPACVHPDIPSVRDAEMITIVGQSAPNRRACPTCGKVVEHTGKRCKMMICPRCKIEYCFLCLQLREKCFETASNSWHTGCGKKVAPKQTSIPIWSRN